MSTLRKTESVSKTQDPLQLDDELSINLRHSCIDCPFVVGCPVAQQSGGPDVDVLVGSYRVSALKERCLL